jgi:PAS domain S-box-containing protein
MKTPDELHLIAFECAPIGLVMTESRVIRACNPAFAAMFGYEREELVDQSFAILYPSVEEFMRIRDVGVEPLRKNNRYSDERIMARKDGTLFWCRVRGHSLTRDDDPLRRAVWSFADLSETRQVLQTVDARAPDYHASGRGPHVEGDCAHARHLAAHGGGLSGQAVEEIRGQQRRGTSLASELHARIALCAVPAADLDPGIGVFQQQASIVRMAEHRGDISNPQVRKPDRAPRGQRAPSEP